MGAVVLPGATIGANAFIDAGAVVGAGATVAAGQLWTGSPARFLRTLTADEVKYLHAMAAELSTLALQHAAQGAKSVAEVEADVEVRLYRRERGFPEGAALPVTEEEVLEYYKLSTPGMPGSASLLRDHEYDEAAEAAARESAEAAADAEENAQYNRVARLRCVGESAAREPVAPPVGTLARGWSLSCMGLSDSPACGSLQARGRGHPEARVDAHRPARPARRCPLRPRVARPRGRGARARHPGPGRGRGCGWTCSAGGRARPSPSCGRRGHCGRPGPARPHTPSPTGRGPSSAVPPGGPIAWMIGWGEHPPPVTTREPSFRGL